MKRLLTILLVVSSSLLLCGNRVANKSGSGGGHATAPVFVAEAHNDDAGVTSVTVTTTINAGEAVVVSVGEALASVLSVTDTGGSVYTLKKAQSGFRDIEIWGTLSASASTSLTVTFSGTAIGSVSVLRYTGVNAFGNVGFGSGSSQTTATASTTTQDANNVVVMGAICATPSAATGTAGTIRLNNFQNNQGTFSHTALDRVGTSAGSLATTFTMSATDWVAATVELRSVP